MAKCSSLRFWLTQRRKDRQEWRTSLAFLASLRENCELLSRPGSPLLVSIVKPFLDGTSLPQQIDADVLAWLKQDHDAA
jgi:hypothetical protein